MSTSLQHQESQAHSRSATADRSLHPAAWLIPIALLIASGCCLTIDLPVARFFHAGQYPGFLRELVENTEPFGHGIGVVLLLSSLALVHREQSLRYVTAGAIALGAGLCTNVIKFTYGRTRPRDLELAGADFADTFTGWFPILQDIGGSQSFPSGHTTVAWALAVVLTHLFPTGRGLFFTLAVFVAYGRVQCGAHYPSDVFAGAALGWTVATLVLNYGPVRVRAMMSDPVPSSSESRLTITPDSRSQAA